MIIIKQYTNISDIKEKAKTNGQLYIYVIQNEPQQNIKIGRSCDIQSRIQSLSGSNNGGNKIARIAVSKPTYLYTLERILHARFKHARISGTEWFDSKQTTFEEVCAYVDFLFASSSYQLCNKVRKNFNQVRPNMLGKSASIQVES